MKRPESALVGALAPVVRAVVMALAADPEALGALREIRAALAEPAAAPEDPTRLLSKGELAQKLSVSPSTIDRLTRSGMPVAAFLGDARRYRLSDCEGWLAAHASPRKRGGKREPKAVAP